MQIQNLQFFDKNGYPLNFETVTDGEGSYISGSVFMQPLSIALFDNINFYVLEKVGSDYVFPVIGEHESILFKWVGQDDTNIFLYDVQIDSDTRLPYINKVRGVDIEYHSGLTDLKYPLEFNVAFCPSDEVAYERDLEIWVYDDQTDISTLVAKIHFYGEGVAEDERFNVWLQNFGIRFNRTDALMLADYDIKEAMPDWQMINQKRKELLVNRSEIFPYIGTYRGLNNIIGILGFADILRVKEYWKDVDQTSAYFDKYLLVDITDVMDAGKVENFNLPQLNRNIKYSDSFRKTGFLALAYEFTRESGRYDSDGVPIVEETTDFTPSEVFFKLNKLKDLLMNEYLPVNVVIKDIIGEFLYFEKNVFKFWPDEVINFEAKLNEDIDIVVSPQTDLRILDISTLYRQRYDSVFPAVSFNTTDYIDPYVNNQMYEVSEMQKFAGDILNFYQSRVDYYYGKTDGTVVWEYGDNLTMSVGCPVVLQFSIPKLSISDFSGLRWSDMRTLLSRPGVYPEVYNKYYTWENVNYRNLYEIEWIISKTEGAPYRFKMRGRLDKLNTLAHVLPYAGKYRIEVKAYDYYGGASIKISDHIVEVLESKPEIVGMSRVHDKYSNRLSDYSNVRLSDLGDSKLYNPIVNVMYNENVDVNIKSNLFDWYNYRNYMYGLKVWHEDYGWETYAASHAVNKRQWGTGEKHSMTLGDFQNARVEDLFFLRPCDCVYHADYLAGFDFRNPHPGDVIVFDQKNSSPGGSLYPEYVVPSPLLPMDYESMEWLEWLASEMNGSYNPAVKLFRYVAIERKVYNKQTNSFDVVGNVIHAEAVEFDSASYMTVSYVDNYDSSPAVSGISGDPFTYGEPYWAYSESTMSALESNYPQFRRESLLTYAPYGDMFSGKTNSIDYWLDNKSIYVNDGEVINGIPSVLDQNPFGPATVKYYTGTSSVPRFAIVFFVINNIPSKSDVVWTLSNDSGEVFKVKDVPFFVWKFEDLGSYSINADVYDSNGNIFYSGVKNMINVLPFDEYIYMTERYLDNRKISILMEDKKETSR